MLAKIAATVVLVGIILGMLLFFTHPASSTYRMTTVTIGSTTISAKIADTDALRELGLSGTQSLPQGQGMLFIFQTPGNYAFWMKDMNYALDILWANASGTITTIHPNLSPQTYPQAFYPQTPDALYVLEVPAGYSAEKNIKVGDTMQIVQ